MKKKERKEKKENALFIVEKLTLDTCFRVDFSLKTKLKAQSKVLNCVKTKR